jgi:hypothetical protein
VQIGNRNQIARQVPAEQLADVRATAKAVITGAALWSPGHTHAIAHLDASDFRSNGLDDSDAAVSLHDGHVVEVGACQAHRRYVCCTGWWCRLQSQYRANVRVAQIAGFGANDNLAACDWT